MVKTAYNTPRKLGDTVSAITYKVIIHPAEEGGYWATCAMPNGGCTTQGETLKEIQQNMIEAVDFYLEDYPDIIDYYLDFEVSHA